MSLTAVTAAIAPGVAGALTHGPAPRLTLGCIWAKAPEHVTPVLTTAQASVDLGQTVKYAGATGPLSNYSCTWEGKPLPKVANPESPKYTVQLWVDLYWSASPTAANKLYHQMLTSWGTSTAVHGLGTAAAYIPGQDIVTAQIVVLSGPTVFWVELSTKEALATQRHQLLTVAHQVVTRLAL